MKNAVCGNPVSCSEQPHLYPRHLLQRDAMPETSAVNAKRAKRGRDVPKISSILLLVFFTGALASAQETQEISGRPQPGLQASYVGDHLSCSRPETLRIPDGMARKAKLKARLLNLLRDSLYDDAKGVVNTGREKEIRKLASELKKD